jgi:hypothetical protein
MKKLIRVAAIVSALALAPVLPAVADDFIPKYIDERGGNIALNMMDNNEEQEVISRIQQLGSYDHRNYYCDSLTSAECGGELTPNKSVNAILPICGSELENCIAGVSIYKSGTPPNPAKYVKNFSGVQVASEPGIKNPRGVSPSLWSAPDVVNSAGTTDYVVSPRLTYYWQGGQIKFSSFAASVNAVAGVTGSRFKAPTVLNYPNANPPTSDPQVQWDTCAVQDVNFCAKRVDFAKDTHVALTLKLTAGVTGWLHGRIKSPVISSSPINSEFNLVTIDAEVVNVPKMYVVMKSADIPEATLARIIYPDVSTGTLASWAKPERWRGVRASGEQALTIVPLAKSAAKDTAASVGTVWRIESLNALDGSMRNTCMGNEKQLGGIVATNAMAYDGGVPTWDGHQLNYRVAGMHFLPDGQTPVEGTYDLAIKSDLARCLYDFSNAPIQATVQVFGENGESKVATTVVSEKNGWLHLAAYGFTFSSPTISVKLSQAKAPAKKTTVTCAKGKLTKKVTAVGPKCPAGYKKK